MNPHRIITLTTAQGPARVRVPRSLHLFEPPDDFVEGVIEKVAAILLDDGMDGEMHLLKTPKGLEGTLLTKTRNGAVYWGFRPLGPRPEVDAAGVFYLGQDRATGSLSGARAPIRGRGLYGAVLMRLRKHLGVPLVSDKILSAASILVWAKHGEVDEDEGVFHINPATTVRIGVRQMGAAVAVAKSLMATE